MTTADGYRQGKSESGPTILGRYSRIDRPNSPLWRRLPEFTIRATPTGELRRPWSCHGLPFGEDQDIVGITNSAPARMPVGQRVVIVFSLV